MKDFILAFFICLLATVIIIVLAWAFRYASMYISEWLKEFVTLSQLS